VRALELFAGAGGAALGLHRAGFEHALMVERDEHAAATLTAANLGPVECADVRQVDYSAHRGIGLMWASPPCQCWSSAGKRLGAADTERNGWPWTWDVVDAVRPRFFVAENVPGLLQHSKAHHPNPERCSGCYWEQVIVPAARARFAWVGVWRLNAADYGVPQTRRRVFLVGGPHHISQPAPSHGDPATLGGLFETRQRWRTVRDALGIEAAGYVYGAGVTGQSCRPVGKASPTIGGRRNVYMDSPSPRVDASEYKGHTNPDRRPGRGLNRASDALYLATGRRRLTVEECGALQAFPPSHPWRGGVTAQYRQVGNAVPPPLSEAIGRAILRSHHRPGRP
jgi:DNA (cytosine-5)-methyltransferase 1